MQLGLSGQSQIAKAFVGLFPGDTHSHCYINRNKMHHLESCLATSRDTNDQGMGPFRGVPTLWAQFGGVLHSPDESRAQGSQSEHCPSWREVQSRSQKGWQSQVCQVEGSQAGPAKSAAGELFQDAKVGHMTCRVLAPSETP